MKHITQMRGGCDMKCKAPKAMCDALYMAVAVAVCQ